MLIFWQRSRQTLTPFLAGLSFPHKPRWISKMYPLLSLVFTGAKLLGPPSQKHPKLKGPLLSPRLLGKVPLTRNPKVSVSA